MTFFPTKLGVMMPPLVTPVNQRPRDYRHVVLLMDRSCLYFGDLQRLSLNARFPDNLFRPEWITHAPNSDFLAYSVYLELSHSQRYLVVSLRETHDGPHHFFAHHPLKAEVAIGDRTYFAFSEDFGRYNSSTHNPEVQNDHSGWIYVTIKGFRQIFYAPILESSYIDWES